MLKLRSLFLVSLFVLPIFSFSQEDENMEFRVIRDSNGVSLNINSIIDQFTDFDQKIAPVKSRIFENDSLIQNQLYSLIPVKKIDSVHIYLYASTFAAIYNNRQEFLPAAYFYKLALKSNPKELASLSFVVGTCYYLSSQLDSAEKYLLISYELNPQNADVLNNLGWISAEQGNPKKALDYFEMAFNIYPNDPAIQNNFGYGLYLNNELEEAEKNIMAAKANARENPFVYRNLGLIFMKKGKQKKACRYLKKSIDLGILNWGESYILELQNYCKE